MGTENAIFFNYYITIIIYYRIRDRDIFDRGMSAVYEPWANIIRNIDNIRIVRNVQREIVYKYNIIQITKMDDDVEMMVVARRSYARTCVFVCER